MHLRLKTGVVFNAAPELAAAIGWIEAQWAAYGMGEFTVTSLKDGTHQANSQHKQHEPESVPGEAVDIRTRDFWDEQAKRHDERVHTFARMLQKEGFRVVLHPDWLHDLNVAPHLHVGLGNPVFLRDVD
jgi:hypothetical protein